MLYPRSCVRQCLCSTSVYSICLELKMHHKLAISYLIFFLDVGQNPDNSISLRKFHFSCCCCSLTTVLEQVLEHNNMEYSDTPVCVIHSGIFGTSADWHTQWHHPKHPNVGRGKKTEKHFGGGGWVKMGTQREYFQQHLYSTAWPIYDLAQRP